MLETYSDLYTGVRPRGRGLRSGPPMMLGLKLLKVTIIGGSRIQIGVLVSRIHAEDDY